MNAVELKLILELSAKIKTLSDKGRDLLTDLVDAKSEKKTTRRRKLRRLPKVSVKPGQIWESIATRNQARGKVISVNGSKVFLRYLNSGKTVNASKNRFRKWYRSHTGAICPGYRLIASGPGKAPVSNGNGK